MSILTVITSLFMFSYNQNSKTSFHFIVSIVDIVERYVVIDFDETQLDTTEFGRMLRVAKESNGMVIREIFGFNVVRYLTRNYKKYESRMA